MASFRDLRARLVGAGLEPKFAVVSGAAANAPIAVSGIKPQDALVAVLEFQPPTAASGNAIVADRAAQTTIGNGTITINTDTSANQLLVVWWST